MNILTKKWAYYNEIDPLAAQWIRNLIKAGLVAPGEVDERSIEDVLPSDVRNFIQCHWFAGVAVWSYALRCAGWDDNRPVWTASCPCQPFSTAGKKSGFADERHLWPDFYHLVTQCKPDVIFGEQVASKDAESWIDLVQTDLEGMGYAFGAVPFPAASVGAPHIRDRLYWVADSDSKRLEGWGGMRKRPNQRVIGSNSVVSGVADDLMQQRSSATADRNVSGGRDKASSEIAGLCQFSRLAEHTDMPQHNKRSSGREQSLHRQHTEPIAGQPPSCPTNGFWRDADWLFCRDGKWRPVEARIQQMVDGAPLRMGPLCTNLKIKVEDALNEASNRLQTQAGEILRTLRETVNCTNLFEWGGRLLLVHETQILLAYLLEYTRENWGEQDATHGTSARYGTQRDLRMLWQNIQTCNSPHQRKLAGQSHREFANALRLLSSAVARFASEATYPNIYENAPASFPLGEFKFNSSSQDSLGIVRPTNRMVKLRAYGNCIVAPQAQIFIESYMELNN
jgi:DNA (cytosine-5)-methyltransferase 1